jgi:ribosomal protein L11 methyltransferase
VGLFFQNEPDVDALRRELAPALGGSAPEEIEVTAVPERDWIAASAMHHEPVRVGRFFVHAAKDRGRVPAGAVAIEVEAGMAFGSGEHATTQACLEAVDALARSRRFRGVLDLGCGSGILAIAAARCWSAARVVAADSDPVAVRVAAENLALNGVAGGWRRSSPRASPRAPSAAAAPTTSCSRTSWPTRWSSWRRRWRATWRRAGRWCSPGSSTGRPRR